MKTGFSYSCQTVVHFGPGTSAQVAEVLPATARHIVLVRGQSGRASAPVLAALRKAGLEVIELSCAGEPTVTSIDAALAQLEGAEIDAVISCGGGAAIDTGKAVSCALSHGASGYAGLAALSDAQMNLSGPVPHIALPTTAGTGAEVTANAVIGVPEKQAKISLRGRGLFPAVALVDPDLMRDAPASVILHAGLDAVTQVFESYTSIKATPFSDALTGAVLAMGLPALKRALDAGDKSAMDDLAWVSHVSGLALANSGLGAAHGLASVIGGRFDAPHGALCGRLLCPVLRQNLARAPDGSDAKARIAELIAHISDVFQAPVPQDPLSGLEAWIGAQGLPRLADWAVVPGDLEGLAAQGMTASSSQKNAVPLSQSDYVAVMQAAL